MLFEVRLLLFSYNIFFKPASAAPFRPDFFVYGESLMEMFWRVEDSFIFGDAVICYKGLKLSVLLELIFSTNDFIYMPCRLIMGTWFKFLFVFIEPFCLDSSSVKKAGFYSLERCEAGLPEKMLVPLFWMRLRSGWDEWSDISRASGLEPDVSTSFISDPLYSSKILIFSLINYGRSISNLSKILSSELLMFLIRCVA